jgi:hypothetical protein
VLIGGPGNDVGEGGEGNDVIIAGAGNDNMQGEGGDDWLFGGSGNDILTGNQGNDLVAGGTGDDRLSGADGDDIVIGGRDSGRAGRDPQGIVVVTATGDFLEGNGGADDFVWEKGDGVDLLLDFNPAEGDTLTVYGYGAAAAVQRTQDGRYAIYLDTDSAIVFNNSPFQDLSANPLPGVRFVASLDQAPDRLLGTDSVIPVLARNWASIFQGQGAIPIAQDFPTDPGAPTPEDLSDVTFDRFQQFAGADDVITLGAGNDWVDGGGGFDTVRLLQGFRPATVTALPGGALRVDGSDGTDLLSNVEAVHFVDGTLQLSPDSAAAQVFRLYQAVLGRAPDQGGLNYWIDQIGAGAPLQNLADGFLFSQEYATRFGNPSNQDFVSLVYQNVLGRPADPGGAAFWEATLAAGGSRATMLIGFSESPEYKAATAAAHPEGFWDLSENAAAVARLYDTVFGRLPDVVGLDFWRGQLDTGALQLRDVAANYVASGEFQATYGALDNPGFVNAIYQNTLDRPADPGGRDFWVGQLQAGMTRAEVILAFSESAEHVGLTAPNIMSEAADQFGIAFA